MVFYWVLVEFAVSIGVLAGLVRLELLSASKRPGRPGIGWSLSFSFVIAAIVSVGICLLENAPHLVEPVGQRQLIAALGSIQALLAIGSAGLALEWGKKLQKARQSSLRDRP